MANKNVIMHPITNGSEDTATNLFPQTIKENILNFNVVSSDINSTSATNGDVLTANGSGGAFWASPSVVQNLTTNVTATLDATAWNNLKSNHYAIISSPTMTELDSNYEFVDIKLSINSNNVIVKLTKNTTNKYSGLFFIEESTNLYEIIIYYNGSDLILRCATVY